MRLHLPDFSNLPQNSRGTRDGLAGGVATILLLFGAATGSAEAMLVLMFVGLAAMTVIYRGRLAFAVWAFLIALGVAIAISFAMRGWMAT